MCYVQDLTLTILKLAYEFLVENIESQINLFFGFLKIINQLLLVILYLQLKNYVFIVIRLIHRINIG